MALKIGLFNHQKDLTISSRSVRSLVLFVLKENKIGRSLFESIEQVDVHLVSVAEIKKIHHRFFKKKNPTDCISIPIDETVLGDVFLCPKVAQEMDPDNPHKEASLYLIHGLLHLLGYDDVEPSKRRSMWKEQNRLLKKADESGCLLKTTYR